MLPPLPPDPYKILGVDRKAQTPEIRTAYRKKVLTCHPDKVGPLTDEKVKDEKLAEFQRVQQAYEILSNEEERSKYDDQLHFIEMRKDMAKNMANTSVPRSPAYHMKVNVRTAEPRSSSFGPGPGSGPMPMPRVVPVYAEKQHARSPHDDDYLFVSSEGLRRGERPSTARRDSRDEDREREREKHEKARRRREREERELQRDREEDERARERERERLEDLRRQQEKDAARRERKKRDDKDRDRKQEKKSRHRSPVWIEEYETEDVVHTSKKKSSSRKHEEKHRERERHVEPPPQPTVEEPVKMQENLNVAREYLRRRQTGDRTASFDSAAYGASPPAAPTPPPAPGMDSPFRPPTHARVDDESDDEYVHRSRATPRRDSYGMSHSRERLGHKKSYSGGPREEPVIFSASPSNRGAPIYVQSVSTPPMAPDSPPRAGMHRAQTFASERPGPVPLQSFHRAKTFDEATRGRGRSRMVPQSIEILSEEEDEEEARRIHYKEKSRRSRKTQSPEPMPMPSHSRSHKSKSGREKLYRDSNDGPTTYYHVQPRGGVRVVDPYYSRSGSGPAYVANKVRTGKPYAEEDVKYASYQGQQYPPAVSVGDGYYR